MSFSSGSYHVWPVNDGDLLPVPQPEYEAGSLRPVPQPKYKANREKLGDREGTERWTLFYLGTTGDKIEVAELYTYKKAPLAQTLGISRFTPEVDQRSDEEKPEYLSDILLSFWYFDARRENTRLDTIIFERHANDDTQLDNLVSWHYRVHMKGELLEDQSGVMIKADDPGPLYSDLLNHTNWGQMVQDMVAGHGPRLGGERIVFRIKPRPRESGHLLQFDPKKLYDLQVYFIQAV